MICGREGSKNPRIAKTCLRHPHASCFAALQLYSSAERQQRSDSNPGWQTCSCKATPETLSKSLQTLQTHRNQSPLHVSAAQVRQTQKASFCWQHRTNTPVNLLAAGTHPGQSQLQQSLQMVKTQALTTAEKPGFSDKGRSCLVFCDPFSHWDDDVLMIYRQASLHFVRQAWRLLKDHLWPVLLIFILCDAAAFATNRISHRLTNEGQHSYYHAPLLCVCLPHQS